MNGPDAPLERLGRFADATRTELARRQPEAQLIHEFDQATERIRGAFVSVGLDLDDPATLETLLGTYDVVARWLVGSTHPAEPGIGLTPAQHIQVGIVAACIVDLARARLAATPDTPTFGI